MPLQTDMNDRERTRFAKVLRDMAKQAEEAAVALDNGDDSEFAASFIIFSMMGMGLKEMQEVLVSAIKKEKGVEQPEFPETIGG